MDEYEAREFNLEEFLKPKCPVQIGDKFYKDYKVPNHLIIYEVLSIEEKSDEQGPFYAITAKANNIQVGANTKVFSSRYLMNGDYVFIKKGGRR